MGCILVTDHETLLTGKDPLCRYTFYKGFYALKGLWDQQGRSGRDLEMQIRRCGFLFLFAGSNEAVYNEHSLRQGTSPHPNMVKGVGIYNAKTLGHFSDNIHRWLTSAPANQRQHHHSRDGKELLQPTVNNEGMRNAWQPVLLVIHIQFQIGYIVSSK